MTAPEPTQPLTEAERAERANERADALEMAAVAWKYSDESVSMKPNVADWLRRRAAARRSGTADEQQSEVDRLRAENTAQATSLDQYRSFPTEPGPGEWSTSYRMGYADAGRDVRALVRALDQSGEGQVNG